MQTQAQTQKIIILAGPTASGKTALLQSMNEWACRGYGTCESSETKDSGDIRVSGVEVINCDSIQVYRHLDIASAKPSVAELAAVPHHLIGILDPSEKFTAGFFVRKCDELIPQIVARGNIPIISGGTVFYLKNFLFGLAEIPQLTGKFTKELEALQNKELHQRLLELDCDSANRIHPHDRQRLLRACAVSLETDRGFSTFKSKESIRSCYLPLVLSLEVARDELYRRIDLRVEAMFRNGLEREILKLKKLGYTGKEHGLQGIGYRECFQNPESKVNFSLRRRIPLIQQNSRNYAKRQITFLKQLPDMVYYKSKQSEEIFKHIEEFYCS